MFQVRQGLYLLSSLSYLAGDPGPSKQIKKNVSKCLCVWDGPLRDAGCWLLLLQYVTVTKVTNCILSVGQQSRRVQNDGGKPLGWTGEVLTF